MRDGQVAFDRARAQLGLDEVQGLYTARAA
jgi:hypothetical protein